MSYTKFEAQEKKNDISYELPDPDQDDYEIRPRRFTLEASGWDQIYKFIFS